MAPFDNIPGLISSLAGDALGAFVVAVVLDNALGILDAVVGGTFSMKKLPSFLESTFGTKQALAVLGLVVAAAATGGDAHQAALAAITAGGGALTLSILADAYGKAKGLVSKPKATAAVPASK